MYTDEEDAISLKMGADEAMQTQDARNEDVNVTTEVINTVECTLGPTGTMHNEEFLS